MQPLREVEFGPHDEALREDVRRLGRIVGDILIEQEGDALFARVEAARKTAIERRERDQPMNALAAQLQGLDPSTADALSRAFAIYFQVVNIAERVHRIRRRREYEIAGAAPQPDGLHAVLLRLRDAGVGADELMATIARLDVEPVFTAHPTEASRRALLEKEQDILRALIADLGGQRTPREDAADLQRLRMSLTSSWQTADTSRLRPTVADELDHVVFYLADPIYRVLPAFHESFEDALRAVYAIETELPRVLRFASWVGGDMDGNPNVDAKTIAATLRTQRSRVLACYRQECEHLARALSQTLDRVGVTAELLARLETYRGLLPEIAQRIRPRHADMPYRSFLRLIDARLAATESDEANGYSSVAEFADDIALIATSLRQHGGTHAGGFAVQRLQRRIAAFGFHLARLDARQDSRVHSLALSSVLGALPDAIDECASLLAPFAKGDRALPAPDRAADPDDEAGAALVRTSAVFSAIGEARTLYGNDAFGIYIISMAGSATDLLAVLTLARAGGLVDDGGHVPLDIAPLFETIADLRGARTTFAALLAHPVYRTHLAARGDRQTVMLGYSDSAKDGGILAARWVLQRAQVELLEVARDAGVDIVFFHGRGGSVSRGGGKTSRAVMAAPRGVIGAHLRVTEQGEVIHAKYGMRAIALRNFEQTVGSVLAATLRPRPADAREARWRDAMGRLAADGESAYRTLLEKSPGFVEYFRAATPIDVIERMTLGSRPARRGGSGGVDSLRAIPWVFAWTQCRSNLPGWFGVGAAIDAATVRGDEEMLKEMTREWAFFRTLIEDLQMVLGKSDLKIAERFSLLAGPLHDTFFPILAAEFARTVDGILRLLDRDHLLADDPRLALSLRLRNPYADPMNLIQVDLLQRWREAGRGDDAVFGALVSTVHGVAQALQNTG